MTESPVHFVNLTRGLYCCPVGNPHYLRLQSTWCEQKRWADILVAIGPDFLAHLALGSQIVVHDLSERPRVTRACWQGLVWVRFACERLWGAPERPALVRSGHDATKYFDDQLRRLDDRVRKGVSYYRKLYEPRDGTPELAYRVCTKWREEAP